MAHDAIKRATQTQEKRSELASELGRLTRENTEEAVTEYVISSVRLHVLSLRELDLRRTYPVLKIHIRVRLNGLIDPSKIAEEAANAFARDLLETDYLEVVRKLRRKGQTVIVRLKRNPLYSGPR